MVLKVTKFLVKISQFEFLVTTEQKIVFYKLLFVSLSIPDVSLFNVEKLQPSPPEKVNLPFPSNPPLKTEVLSSPPLFENLVGGSTPRVPAERGVHAIRILYSIFSRDSEWSL